jgi:hypothetical protein
MLHVLQHAISIVNDLPGRLALDVGNKTNTTRVVFIGGIVEATGVRESIGSRHCGFFSSE